MILAFEKHAVKSNEILGVDLVDEHNMPIDEENAHIIEQYKGCSHFFIEILIDFRHTELNLLVEVSSNQIRFLRLSLKSFTIHILISEY